jgi:hypothetical protein
LSSPLFILGVTLGVGGALVVIIALSVYLVRRRSDAVRPEVGLSSAAAPAAWTGVLNQIVPAAADAPSRDRSTDPRTV